MRKDFYVFRHGETDLNLQKRWQGSGVDYDINETGLRQAEELAAKLKDKNLEVIFSSPLIRARHTAETVASERGLDIFVKDDLRECFYGTAEGQLIADLERDVPEVVKNWYNPSCWDIRFEGGESKKEALERVFGVLNSIIKEPYNTIGIAIHGGTMGALLNYFHFDFVKIPNCGTIQLVYENNQWKLCGEIF